MGGSLRVVLESPSDGAKPKPRLFIPGDVVAGKVVLSLQEAANIESISIELEGGCKTKVTYHDHIFDQTHTYFYTSNFLNLKETLFAGPYKMRASTYEYPFSFRLPETYDHEGGPFKEKSFAPEYSLPGPKPMPLTCTGHGYQIYYHLKARIPRTFSDWVDKKVLTFSPARRGPDPAPIPQNTDKSNASPCRRHYRITDGGTCRKLTMGESIKEAFHHSAATSTVNFTLNATVPMAIVIGNSSAVDMTLTCLDSANGNPQPLFTLKSYTLFLMSGTTIRAAEPHKLYSFERAAYFNLRSEIIRCTLNIPLPYNETIRVNGLFPTGETYTCPTFVYNAVKRSYGLELKAVVECLGEEIDFKLKWGSVVLLPARMIGGGSREILIEKELPRYDEGAGSTSVVPQVEGDVSDHKDVEEV